MASSASAALIFSNVNITGSIAGTPTVTTGVSDIDFSFGGNAGTVGDPVAPLRSGNIVITFDVLSTSGAITTDFANFKVKKTFFLFAPDTQATDIANVSLVEQRFVPTPGSLALLGLGGLVASRRRR
jgi:hypothetical protein